MTPHHLILPLLALSLTLPLRAQTTAPAETATRPAAPKGAANPNLKRLSPDDMRVSYETVPEFLRAGASVPVAAVAPTTAPAANPQKLKQQSTDLITLARAHYAAKHYDDAAAPLKAALIIDPDNEDATKFLRDVSANIPHAGAPVSFADMLAIAGTQGQETPAN